MKKITAILSVFCAVLVLFACSTDSDDDVILGDPIADSDGNRIIKFGTPTIDGELSAGEWGNPVLSGITPSNAPVDLEDSWFSDLHGLTDQTNWADVYFRWDDSNLYFAADVKRVRPNAPVAEAATHGQYASFWIKVSVGETTWAPQFMYYKLTDDSSVLLDGGGNPMTLPLAITFTDDSDINNTRLVYEGTIPWNQITQMGNAAVEGDVLRIAIQLRSDTGYGEAGGSSYYAVGTAMNLGTAWLTAYGSWHGKLYN